MWYLYPERVSPRAYSRSVTNLLLTNLLCSSSSLLEFLDFVELAYEENPWQRTSDRQQALNDCVAVLPSKSKRLLALKYDEGYPLQKIAQTVDQSTAAVVKALLRLRQALSICVEKKLKLSAFGL